MRLPFSHSLKYSWSWSKLYEGWRAQTTPHSACASEEFSPQCMVESTTQQTKQKSSSIAHHHHTQVPFMSKHHNNAALAENRKIGVGGGWRTTGRIPRPLPIVARRCVQKCNEWMNDDDKKLLPVSFQYFFLCAVIQSTPPPPPSCLMAAWCLIVPNSLYLHFLPSRE